MKNKAVPGKAMLVDKEMTGVASMLVRAHQDWKHVVSLKVAYLVEQHAKASLKETTSQGPHIMEVEKQIDIQSFSTDNFIPYSVIDKIEAKRSTISYTHLVKTLFSTL